MRIGLFTTGTEETPTSWSNWTKIISENSIGDGIRDTNGIISVPEYEGATGHQLPEPAALFRPQPPGKKPTCSVAMENGGT